MTPLDQLPVEGAEPEVDGGGPRMSFLGHLEELRKRLFRAFAGVMLALIVTFSFQDRVFHFIVGPVEAGVGKLAQTEVAGAFMAKFKAAFLAGIVLALPYIIFELWRFIAPGLLPRERRWVVPVMLVGTLLFLSGAGFAYVVIVPGATRFLIEQGQEFQQIITIDSAFSFGTKLLLGLGLMFEMPLVIFALSRLGLVSAGFLLRHSGVAVFLIFVVSAVLTPTPDIFTMTLFALPLLVLYFVGIGIAWIFQRRDGSRRGAAAPPG